MSHLCYVKNKVAWFSSVPAEHVHGDDWNDKPYEHNASPPYGIHGGGTFKVVMFDGGRLWELCELFYNSPYSIDDLNKRKAAPWLTTENSRWYQLCGNRIEIYADASLEEFTQKVLKAGGMVYLPIEKERETNVIVVVRGGVVEDVYVNKMGVNVEIYDMDTEEYYDDEEKDDSEEWRTVSEVLEEELDSLLGNGDYLKVN